MPGFGPLSIDGYVRHLGLPPTSPSGAPGVGPDLDAHGTWELLITWLITQLMSPKLAFHRFTPCLFIGRLISLVVSSYRVPRAFK